MYHKDNYTQFPRKVSHAFIYTMNETDESMKKHGAYEYLVASQKPPVMDSAKKYAAPDLAPCDYHKGGEVFFSNGWQNQTDYAIIHKG